jgi:cobyrinic acid a,c-diamide synthase
MHAFVVAGTHSGCGKTTVCLGLLAALKKKGLSVQPFKAGPDFIDSGLHRIATGRISRNLDLWMCGETYVRGCFSRHASDADAAVVEGVMGLYDGPLSTAVLASVLDLPVILVVDAYGMAESAAPLVKGFRDWAPEGGRPPAALGGVIFNRVGSSHHYERLCRALTEVPVLGYLPRDLHFEIPHRHLGLVVAEELPLSPEDLDRLSDTVLRSVDIGALLALANGRGPASAPAYKEPEQKKGRPAATRVAVASDRAFCFYYQDNLDFLREAGAEIVFFSPLADACLPPGIGAVYLGGGYPELHALELSRNGSMRRSILEWAERGGPVYAECGGLMYLSRSLRDFDRRRFEMAGVFPFETEMARGNAHLGYREVLLKADCLLGAAGERVKGHEFHYSEISAGPAVVDEVYAVKNGAGADLAAEGYRCGNVLGSYIHTHFGSNRSTAEHFVAFSGKGKV